MTSPTEGGDALAAMTAERDEWKARFDGAWKAMREAVEAGPEAEVERLRFLIVRTDVRGLLAEAWADGHEASTESATWDEVQTMAARYADVRLSHHPSDAADDSTPSKKSGGDL